MTAKDADTDVAAFMVTTQVPVPVHAPDHPANPEPTFAAAVSVTTVPNAYGSLQSEPQLMPAGVDVTAPVPAPPSVTVKVKLASVNVAVTDCAAFMATTHVPVPVHAPDQPANVEPTAAAAVNVTVVPNV